MSQQTPTTDKPAPGADEVLDNEQAPPLDDDAEPVAPAEEARAPRADGEDEPQPKPQRRGDPKRDEIAARYRERQREEQGLEPPPPDDGGAPDEPSEGRSQTGLSASEEPPQDDPELELLVYGKRQKFKRSELISAFDLEGLSDDVIIRVAQKEKAADQRLAQAKEAEHQRPSRADSPSQADAQGQPTRPTDQLGATEGPDADGLEPDRSPAKPDQALDAEKLAELATRIQVGDADEGTQALIEFAQMVRASNPGATPEQVSGMVERTLAQREQQTEIYTALKKFGDDNPDLLAESDLFDVALNVAAREMLDDMKKLGLSDAELKPLGNDRRAIAQAHRSLKAQGHQVRSLDQVLADSATALRSKFNMAKPGQGQRSQQRPAAPQADQIRQRVERKESAQPQPRHGGARAAAQQEVRPKTAHEIIREQRKARNFRDLSA